MAKIRFEKRYRKPHTLAKTGEYVAQNDQNPYIL